MTKTQTPRMGQTQYSAGTDSFLRTDYNSDGANMERAAYDDGITHTTLPGVDEVISGRYLMYQPSLSPYRALHRATGQNGEWEPALGNTIPAPMNFRPFEAGDEATTEKALVVSHPSNASPGASIRYDGLAQFAHAALMDDNAAGGGTLHVGTSAAPAPTSLGRAHVRTRQNSDLGLVLQPHGSGAGYMLAAREPGGQDVFTVDSSGYVRARSLSGFGGGAINSGAAVVMAPTSSGVDGVDIGLLLHGQSGATSKVIASVRRDLADTAPIVSIEREAIKLGRLDWGDASVADTGAILAAARQVRIRALGYTADELLWRLSRADAATPGNPATDAHVLAISRTTSLLRVPLVATQELGTSGVNLSLDRYTNFSSRFFQARRATGGGPTYETVAALEADGRMALGARWIATGVTFDARNSLHHHSAKVWGQAGVDNYNVGQTISSGGGSFAYTFATMQMRSTTATDIRINLGTEYCIENETDDFGSAALWTLAVSVNGGSFANVAVRETWCTAVPAGDRPVGTATQIKALLKNVPAGATVAFKATILNNTSSPSPPIYLRMLDLDIEECLVNSYVAP